MVCLPLIQTEILLQIDKKDSSGERNPGAKGMQQISLHTKVSQGAGVSACARKADKRAIRQARTIESREGEHLD